uniref:Secreted protein n=1 Tax=Serinus canaria TaxID=9135 RepID=A0A8C9NHM8_SERCA
AAVHNQVVTVLLFTAWQSFCSSISSYVQAFSANWPLPNLKFFCGPLSALAITLSAENCNREMCFDRSLKIVTSEAISSLWTVISQEHKNKDFKVINTGRQNQP